jgi:hypothetical protein
MCVYIENETKERNESYLNSNASRGEQVRETNVDLRCTQEKTCSSEFFICD